MIDSSCVASQGAARWMLTEGSCVETVDRLEDSMARILGIDFGTITTRMAVMQGGHARIIPNAEGMPSTPSAVSFSERGKPLIGDAAKRRAVTFPHSTVQSIRPLVGCRYDEVREKTHGTAYKVIRDANGDAAVEVKVNQKRRQFNPVAVSAMILAKVRADASMRLREEITRAVVTVPVCFHESQRQAIKDAGRIAGLTVERIINEPTAAALAYGLEKKRNEKVAVFDFGGGIFSISILDIGDNVFEVLSTNAEINLGGDDLDAVLVDYLAGEFRKTEGIDVLQDPMVRAYLKEEAEKAKCELSTRVETTINLPFITVDRSGPRHLQISITRSGFESQCNPLFSRIKDLCCRAIEDAKLRPDDIAEVLMVGGSTRIPKVRQIATEIFGKEPNKSVNPDEVVALGAAIQGAVLLGDVSVKDILLLDATSLSLGVETLGGVMAKLIDRNTSIPTSKKEVFSTTADGQTKVDTHVLQGERAFARDNRTLGRFRLTDIPPAPRGTPQIEVTFDIDANGILHVSAKDLGTGKQQSIEIKSSSGLTDEEIRRMEKAVQEFIQAYRRVRQVSPLEPEFFGRPRYSPS